MNTVLAGAQIHGASAERITWPARHEARQIGLARNHLRRRMPVRPLCLVAHGLHAGPRKAFPADTDSVTDRTALAEHVIKRGAAGIDNDGTGRLARVEGDNSPAQPFRHRAVGFVTLLHENRLARSKHDIVRRKAGLRGGRVAKRLRMRGRGENRGRG